MTVSGFIMLVFMLKIVPSPSKRREVLDILHNVTGPTSIQPGCRACEIYEGALDSQAILYVEEWDRSENLNLHIQSPLYARILAAMDLSTTQPEMEFFESSQIWGMELVESLRGPSRGSPGKPSRLPQE